MQFNIPDDEQLTAAQEGELTCFKLLWPDTPAWRGILAGLIYLVTRGRSWAADSGTITDAQRAGYRLFESNVPLTRCDCDDNPGGPDAPGFADLIDEMYAAAVDGGGDWESEFMWSVTDITIEHGQLVLHYGPCCRKVVTGELLAGGSIEGRNPYDGAIDPGTGKPYQGYACGKAAALVNAVWTALTNLVESANNPTNVIHAITSGQPEVSFDKLDLWGAYLGYVATYLQDEMDPLDLLGFEGGDAVWDTEAILDPRRRQTWICRLSARLDNSTTCTDADIDHLRTVAKQIYSIGVSNAINALISAFGRGDLKTIGAAGAIVQADCRCPDLHTSPDPLLDELPSGTTWAYSFDFTIDDYDFTSHDGTRWVSGVGWSEDTLVGNDMRAVKLSIFNTGQGDDNTKIHFARVQSSEYPTGTITELRYWDVFFFTANGGNTQFGWGQLPPQPVYTAQWPAGAAWGQGEQFILFGGFVRGATPPSGRHTVSKLILAGTGTPPIPGAVNLLA